MLARLLPLLALGLLLGTAALVPRVLPALGRIDASTESLVLEDDPDALRYDRTGLLFSNDELRQRMVDQTVPQAEYLGLTIPDPALRWNDERGHYDYGAIDWREFHDVLKGNGPCNRERLRTRVKAYEDGRWFRDALVAHATKHGADR